MSEVASGPPWPETVQLGNCGEPAGIVKVRWQKGGSPRSSWESFIRSGERSIISQNCVIEPNYPWSQEFEQWDSCHLALGNGSTARTECAALAKWAALPTCMSGPQLQYRATFPTKHTDAQCLIKIGVVDTSSPRQEADSLALLLTLQDQGVTLSLSPSLTQHPPAREATLCDSPLCSSLCCSYLPASSPQSPQAS